MQSSMSQIHKKLKRKFLILLKISKNKTGHNYSKKKVIQKAMMKKRFKMSHPKQIKTRIQQIIFMNRFNKIIEILNYKIKNKIKKKNGLIL